MFEYHVFTEDVFLMQELLEGLDFERDGQIKRGSDVVYYFSSKNVLILQSFISFEDGNHLLDDLLLTLSKNFTIEDQQFKTIRLFE